MNELQKTFIQPDEWQALKTFTAARIALGSTGVSLSTKAALELRLAHAMAKDAVYSTLDKNELQAELEEISITIYSLHSNATHRDEYLQRPDLGRRLNSASTDFLTALPAAVYDISLIIADGLSATAINENAVPFTIAFLQKIKMHGYTVAPLILAEQARVAIADEIGSSLKARLTVILIGERPGLSAADSMGAYITYGPQSGNTDEKRNCVSNIRSGGLLPVAAAEKVANLVKIALQLQLTGIKLKEDVPLLEASETVIEDLLLNDGL